MRYILNLSTTAKNILYSFQGISPPKWFAVLEGLIYVYPKKETDEKENKTKKYEGGRERGEGGGWS